MLLEIMLFFLDFYFETWLVDDLKDGNGLKPHHLRSASSGTISSIEFRNECVMQVWRST